MSIGAVAAATGNSALSGQRHFAETSSRELHEDPPSFERLVVQCLLNSSLNSQLGDIEVETLLLGPGEQHELGTSVAADGGSVISDSLNGKEERGYELDLDDDSYCTFYWQSDGTLVPFDAPDGDQARLVRAPARVAQEGVGGIGSGLQVRPQAPAVNPLPLAATPGSNTELLFLGP